MIKHPSTHIKNPNTGRFVARKGREGMRILQDPILGPIANKLTAQWWAEEQAQQSLIVGYKEPQLHPAVDGNFTSKGAVPHAEPVKPPGLAELGNQQPISAANQLLSKPISPGQHGIITGEHPFTHVINPTTGRLVARYSREGAIIRRYPDLLRDADGLTSSWWANKISHIHDTQETETSPSKGGVAANNQTIVPTAEPRIIPPRYSAAVTLKGAAPPATEIVAKIEPSQVSTAAQLSHIAEKHPSTHIVNPISERLISRTGKEGIRISQNPALLSKAEELTAKWWSDEQDRIENLKKLYSDKCQDIGLPAELSQPTAGDNPAQSQVETVEATGASSDDSITEKHPLTHIINPISGQLVERSSQEGVRIQKNPLVRQAAEQLTSQWWESIPHYCKENSVSVSGTDDTSSQSSSSSSKKSTIKPSNPEGPATSPRQATVPLVYTGQHPDTHIMNPASMRLVLRSGKTGRAISTDPELHAEAEKKTAEWWSKQQSTNQVLDDMTDSQPPEDPDTTVDEVAELDPSK